MARSAALVVAAGLLTVGCSASHGSDVASTASTVQATPSTPAAEPKSKTGEGDGKMVVTYEEATSPEAIPGRDLMQRTHYLDDIAKSVTDWYRLPYDIPVVGRQCGEANDYWSPSDKSTLR